VLSDTDMLILGFFFHCFVCNFTFKIIGEQGEFSFFGSLSFMFSKNVGQLVCTHTIGEILLSAKMIVGDSVARGQSKHNLTCFKVFNDIPI